MAKSADIHYAYTKKRAMFGRQCMFADSATELGVSIPYDYEVAKEFVNIDPADKSFSDPLVMSQHEVNTEYIECVVEGINHTEGGWPKDVSCTDIEQLERHRRKIEREESYVPTVKNLCEMMEHCVLQNNAVNIYEHYFEDEELPPDDETKSAYMKVFSVFR